MTRSEVARLLSILKTSYPSSYRGITDEDARNIVTLWAELFADDAEADVLAAVKVIIVSSDSDFAPSVGKIKKTMVELKNRYSGNELTAADAWAKVKMAMSNGIYHASEEFDALPDKCKRIVGSPSQLRDWAMADADKIDTVVASNFRRAYEALLAVQRDVELLPRDILNLLESRGKTIERRNNDEIFDLRRRVPELPE